MELIIFVLFWTGVFFLGLMILWGIAVFLEDYGYIISEKIKYIWHILMPRNIGVMRLCFIVGATLAGLVFIEIPSDFGVGQIICSGRSCYFFGKPYWITAVIVFCVPFVAAKLIEFIVAGWQTRK